jgi:hypothetical protein
VKRGLTWLLVGPLAVLGSQAAHVVNYWAAAPDHEARQRLLAETGHGYLDQAPLAIALCMLLLVLAVAGRLIEEYRRGGAGSRLALAPFAILPVALFFLQEHLERLLHDGSFPFGLLLEPIFLLGLALQFPFALLAFLVGRALLQATVDLARALGGNGSPRAASTPPSVRSPARVIELPRLSPLAASRAVRGPPS